MVPMVYIAAAIFILGILFKLVMVLSSPSLPGTLGVFPRKVPLPVGILKDSLLVPTAWKYSKIFWFVTIAFHAAFLLLFLGHLELVREIKLIQIIPHDIFLGAGFVGIVLVFTTLYFLFRRFASPVRGISVPEDYILLLLLFLTMVFGSHLHLAARYSETGLDITVADYRAYLGSLAAFKPVVPEEISYSPHYVIVVLHIFFANLFLIFFPFSKMIHAVFTFFAHKLKRK
jgi:nitrate reductase gamma subunit